MLKRRVGVYLVLAPKGIKGKGKNFCLSFDLELESGQQRRRDVVMHTLFSFNLVLINRWHYREIKFNFSRVAILRLPELMKFLYFCLKSFQLSLVWWSAFMCLT